MNGAQEWNRTTDTAIFSRMLYQLSYLGICLGGNIWEADTYPAWDSPQHKTDQVMPMKGGRTDLRRRLPPPSWARDRTR